MKVSCLQMNMKLGCPEENFAHAEQLICNAMKDNADVLVLPETWNTGFFPKENLTESSCRNGYEVNTCIGELAKKYKVNIVAGSVSNVRGGKYIIPLLFLTETVYALPNMIRRICLRLWEKMITILAATAYVALLSTV